MSWENGEYTLIKNWILVGQILVKYWSNNTDKVPLVNWSNTDPILRKYWSSPKPIVIKYCFNYNMKKKRNIWYVQFFELRFYEYVKILTIFSFTYLLNWKEEEDYFFMLITEKIDYLLWNDPLRLDIRNQFSCVHTRLIIVLRDVTWRDVTWRNVTWRNATLFTSSPVVELIGYFWIIWVTYRGSYSCRTNFYTRKKNTK